MKTSSEFLSTAIEAASQVGTRLREMLGESRTSKGVTTKRKQAELGTKADRMTEEHIVRLLRERFPNHGVVAGENGPPRARVPLDYRPHRRDHKFRVRPPGILRFNCSGAQRRAPCWGCLP